ncbi:hypothetical protein RJ639_015411 [Escallonia herrerae]|uniref:CCHC-type domain-containing protein n=1 Tax=Escallonia herrerae TaxID=1293975 RepID=A0AA89AL43_9ASTE|nr:hypothetical protein RJ639_015411 [Escallonia herrerae]
MALIHQRPDLDTIISKITQLKCEETIDLEEDDSNAVREYTLTLLAKVISIKKSNLKAVQTILSKVWNPTKGMKITSLEDNIVCITFNHEWDRTRILAARPWSIMSSHLVVRDWPPNLSINEIEFNYSPLWVRICGLPPNQMTKRNAEKIAEKIGKLKEIDFTSDGKISWFKYLRIRVELDVRKPLQTGFNRNKNDQSKAWIQLQYECLADFCFNCGRLGHVNRLCPSPPLEKPENFSSPFGPWLRAEYSESTPPEAEWNPTSPMKEPKSVQKSSGKETYAIISTSSLRSSGNNLTNPHSISTEIGRKPTDAIPHLLSDDTIPKISDVSDQPLFSPKTNPPTKQTCSNTLKPPKSDIKSLNTQPDTPCQPPPFFPNYKSLPPLNSNQEDTDTNQTIYSGNVSHSKPSPKRKISHEEAHSPKKPKLNPPHLSPIPPVVSPQIQIPLNITQTPKPNTKNTRSRQFSKLKNQARKLPSSLSPPSSFTSASIFTGVSSSRLPLKPP